MGATSTQSQSIEVSAVVRRANGTVEDHGLVAASSDDPAQEARYRNANLGHVNFNSPGVPTMFRLVGDNGDGEFTFRGPQTDREAAEALLEKAKEEYPDVKFRVQFLASQDDDAHAWEDVS